MANDSIGTAARLDTGTALRTRRAEIVRDVHGYAFAEGASCLVPSTQDYETAREQVGERPEMDQDAWEEMVAARAGALAQAVTHQAPDYEHLAEERAEYRAEMMGRE